MTNTTQIDNLRGALSSEIIARTRASLAGVYAAARHAESLLEQLRSLPLVQAAIERRSVAARAQSVASPGPPRIRAADATALELLLLPPDRWHAVLVVITSRDQKTTLKRVIAAADTAVRTAPDRAHRLAEAVLRTVRHEHLPLQAPLLRRQLAGCALLVRARAFITLRAYAEALPLIAEAHSAFPRQATYERYRNHAQLLRAQVLAATGHDAEALQTLTACAHVAIDRIDARALVEALASTAVVLCAHHEYAIARPALSLAAHVARQPGNASSLVVVHAALAECAFLGYVPRNAPHAAP